MKKLLDDFSTLAVVLFSEAFVMVVILISVLLLQECIMSENYLLEEAIILFTALDEESKNFVVSLLKSEVQQDGHQEQCA